MNLVRNDTMVADDAQLPLVTVVSVCFNLLENKRMPLFERNLASVRSQDYPRVEHLVVDGGSRDGSLPRLESFARRGWIRLVSEPDKGIYDAMNKGIRLAQGKYVAFLNSDDFWHHPAGISESVRALEADNAAFSFAPRTIVREDGTFVCTEAAGLGVFPHLMPFCHQTMFTRRDILLKYGGFDAASYRSAADYDLVFRMLLGGEWGIYVPLNFTTFRLGGYSMQGEELSQQECRRVRRTLLGSRAARLMQTGMLDDDLWQRLAQRVHYRVALDMQRCYTPHAAGKYRLAFGLVRRYADKGSVVAAGACSRSVEQWRLFNFLPVLVCRRRPTRCDYLLAGILPLLRLRRKGRRLVCYLFWLLPILCIRTK